MKAFVIAAVNLRRMSRDPVGLFFIFVFPVVLILLLGVTFGGGVTAGVGVVTGDGELSEGLVRELESASAIEVRSYQSRDELRDGVERGFVDAGLEIPSDYDQALASGERVDVTYLARSGDFSTALRSTIDSAIARQAALIRAARFASQETGSTFDDGLRQARRVAVSAPQVEVDSSVAGQSESESDLGRFDEGAASQLILFIFVNSLAAAVALVQTRKLGVSQRMLSTPIRASTILVGEAGGRFAIAMVQGVFIIVAAALIFGVKWGDPLGAAALVTSFCLVSTGAAMLFGAILSNEQQAGALAPVGLALAALGGCMVPLEVFSPTMQTIAHVTPHAWAVEGFTELIRRDAGLPDVIPQLGVLMAFATVLLALATWRLRRALLH